MSVMKNFARICAYFALFSNCCMYKSRFKSL